MARTRNEAAFGAKRQEILRAAEALFVCEGFHQTGMAAICAAVGMSPGALYRYFRSKTEIIRALIEEERAASEALFAEIDTAGDAAEALADALAETACAVNERDYARLALEIAAEAERDPVAGAILADAEAALRARLSAALRRASGGALSAGDAASGATMLYMTIYGAAGLRGPLPSRARLRSAMRRIVEALARG
jgi:AcrR family transcriptional regulator